MSFDDLTPENTIEGGTDGTIIGNVGDRLKTQSAFGDSAQNDAFSRQRVSSPHVLYSAVLDCSDKPLEFTEKLVGGSRVYTKSEAKVRLTGTTTINDRASRQTKQYFRYTAGQSAVRMVTFVMGTGSSGCAQRAGTFDDDNGIFFEQNGTTRNLVIRSSTTGSVIENSAPQASWNIDQFDGTGPSGVTIDFTKNIILWIDYQYLGVGRVRIGFDIGGMLYYAHEFNHANLTTGMYMATPHLPLRWEVFNKAAPAATCYIDALCCCAMVEGEDSNPNIARAVSRGISKVTVGTTILPVISVRLKSGCNRAQLIPKEYQVLLDGGKNFEIIVYLNPSLTGASWVSAGGNSIAEYDISATAISGGDVVEIFYISKEARGGDNIQNTLTKLVSDFDGTSDILTLAARATSGSEDVFAALHFAEAF